MDAAKQRRFCTNTSMARRDLAPRGNVELTVVPPSVRELAGNSAQGNTVKTTFPLDSRTVCFTGSSRGSWFKEETSSKGTGLEAKAFMARNLPMKTLRPDIPGQGYFPWPTVGRTPTEVNSLLPVHLLNGLTTSMSFSDVSWVIAYWSSVSWRMWPLDPTIDPSYPAKLRSVVSCNLL